MLPMFYGIYLATLSVITFAFYLADKIKAQNGSWRIPEKALLLLSFLGGGVGGYLAMHIVRHKTRHWYFHVINVIGILWQISLLVVLIINS